MAFLDIRLKKVNKTYVAGDTIAGVIVVQSRGDLSHQGMVLSMEGTVNLQLSAKSVGLFEAFYNSIKPITLLAFQMEVLKPGRLHSGKTEIPFEVPLKPKANRELYETYHGVFVNIQYLLKVDMKRSLLNKDLQKACEFIVEKPTNGASQPPKPVTFNINPDSIQNVKEKQLVPRFRIKGRIESTNCSITRPFEGQLIVENSETPIKSIELQLVRVETCGCAEGYAKDSTEIQNIQIADGNVCRGMTIPIYMVFPRLFTCPTLATSNFKIEFEVNIVIVFQDDHLVTENFPIKLVRH